MRTTTPPQSRLILAQTAAAVILSLAPFSMASEGSSQRPSIFVAPIDNGMNQALSIWQPAMGEGLAEMLITELAKLNKFQVLETTALESLKDEMKLGEKGWVKLDERVNKGEWAGADYMFRGKITRFGESTNDLGGRGLLRRVAPIDLKINLKKQEVQIDWRIVDVARRTVVASGRATGRNSGVDWNVSSAEGAGGINSSEFRGSALGKATMQAIGKISSDVRNVSVPTSGRRAGSERKMQQAKANEEAKTTDRGETSGKVLGVSTSGFVYVTLGSRDGLKPGDKLNLYEIIEDKDEKGTVLGLEEKLIGELILESVMEEAKSKGKWDGVVKPMVGWVVKILKEMTNDE